MEIQVLNHDFSICKLPMDAVPDLSSEFVFIGKTDGELSLVCPTEDVPEGCLERDDGWRAMRVAGELDFSLVGILAGISQTLAECRISIFAVSTYNTDYVLVKKDELTRAVSALSDSGYVVTGEGSDSAVQMPDSK